jgi:hypothetical protein
VTTSERDVAELDLALAAEQLARERGRVARLERKLAARDVRVWEIASPQNLETPLVFAELLECAAERRPLSSLGERTAAACLELDDSVRVGAWIVKVWEALLALQALPRAARTASRATLSNGAASRRLAGAPTRPTAWRWLSTRRCREQGDAERSDLRGSRHRPCRLRRHVGTSRSTTGILPRGCTLATTRVAAARSTSATSGRTCSVRRPPERAGQELVLHDTGPAIRLGL